MPDEVATDLQEIGKPVVELFKVMKKRVKIKLEVEPVHFSGDDVLCDLGTRYHFDQFRWILIPKLMVV